MHSTTTLRELPLYCPVCGKNDKRGERPCRTTYTENYGVPGVTFACRINPTGFLSLPEYWDWAGRSIRRNELDATDKRALQIASDGLDRMLEEYSHDHPLTRMAREDLHRLEDFLGLGY